MATYTCANGHQSTTSDYCSECGKKLTVSDQSVGTPSAATGASLAAGGAERCPDCDTPRASATAVFCEVCRYNFVTHQPWTPDAPAVPAAPPLTPPVSTTGPAPSGATAPVSSGAPAPVPDIPPIDALRRWEAIVAVDPALYADPDPAAPCPVGSPERVFPLDFSENLIGRRSERRAIFPEIDMSSDHGVSSRHAVVYREGDGSLTLLDVGSTNGTQVNGKDLAAGVRLALHDNDHITLGCWTRITIHALPRAAGQP